MVVVVLLASKLALWTLAPSPPPVTPLPLQLPLSLSGQPSPTSKAPAESRTVLPLWMPLRSCCCCCCCCSCSCSCCCCCRAERRGVVATSEVASVGVEGKAGAEAILDGVATCRALAGGVADRPSSRLLAGSSESRCSPQLFRAPILDARLHRDATSCSSLIGDSGMRDMEAAEKLMRGIPFEACDLELDAAGMGTPPSFPSSESESSSASSLLFRFGLPRPRARRQRARLYRGRALFKTFCGGVAGGVRFV
mmetsp:Transcript_80958/g.168989  ORF Transcript_80958/g.168989 Transcript_80958/m.168989 type:complete len:252 (-) Transcript_80958:336-1091(-)